MSVSKDGTVVAHGWQQQLADGRTVEIPRGTRIQRVHFGPNTPPKGWYFDGTTLTEISE